jgi:ribosome recycling factor
VNEREIQRLRTKLLFAEAEIYSLKEQRKELRKALDAQPKNKNFSCDNCKTLEAKLNEALKVKPIRQSIGKILRKWYPEDYQ